MKLLSALLFAAVMFMCRIPLWPWLILSFFAGHLIGRRTQVALGSSSTN